MAQNRSRPPSDRVHRTSHAVTFRSRFTRPQRFWLELISIGAIVCLTTIAAVFLQYPNGTKQHQWGGYAASATAIPVMLALVAFMRPQTALRINDSSLLFARTRVPRSRVRLRWHEIDRVRWGRQFIVLEGQAGQIWINSTLVTEASWRTVREQVGIGLEKRFDLRERSITDTRSVAHSANNSQAFANLTILVHVVGLPVVMLTSHPVRWLILGILTTLCVIAMIWGTTSARRASWRVPIELGHTPGEGSG